MKERARHAEHSAIIRWHRDGSRFTDLRYGRAHVWEFDGGARVPASSSPHNVALPFSDPSAVDPEEAFVAALSSCHMLCFLSIAAERGFVVDEYVDHASGTITENDAGRHAFSVVTLRPRTSFSGARSPAPAELDAMHEAAREACFIANSVLTEVRCEPVA